MSHCCIWHGLRGSSSSFGQLVRRGLCCQGLSEDLRLGVRVLCTLPSGTPEGMPSGRILHQQLQHLRSLGLCSLYVSAGFLSVSLECATLPSGCPGLRPLPWVSSHVAVHMCQGLPCLLCCSGNTGLTSATLALCCPEGSQFLVCGACIDVPSASLAFARAGAAMSACSMDACTCPSGKRCALLMEGHSTTCRSAVLHITEPCCNLLPWER